MGEPRTAGAGWLRMTDLAARARAGDAGALDGLIRTSLPLVHGLVHRALGDDSSADDVVQDVMLRVVGGLPGLREPSRYRAWLVAVTLHRISTYERAHAAAARRTVPLDETAGRPDHAAEVTGAAALRADLDHQRRQVLRAGRWLDPGHRGPLLVRWLQAAGELSQAEVAEILGVGEGHARVRMQRLRAQLETCRSVVAALDAAPRCAGLAALLPGWDGTPSPLWRKRIARHVRSCPACGAASAGRISTERILQGLALLPVPAAITATVIHKAAGGGAAAQAGPGVLARLIELTGAHPLLTTMTAGALLASGVVAGGLALPDAGPAGPATAAATPQPISGPPAGTSASRPVSAPVSVSVSVSVSAPQPPGSIAAGLRPGRLSLESGSLPGRFVAVAGDAARLERIAPDSNGALRRSATFEVVPGLADPRCSSLRAADGRLLRHASWRLRLDADDGTILFRRDATFCARPGASPGSVRLEASNYPGYFIRPIGADLHVDQSDGSAELAAGSSFVLRPPLG